MSDPTMWRDRMTYHRIETTGMDPNTRLPINSTVAVLEDEPCDLAIVSKRIAQQGPQGTVYNTTRVTRCKVYPTDELDSPDENDSVMVNNVTYKVTAAERTYDAGSGMYRGTALTLTSQQPTDAP